MLLTGVLGCACAAIPWASPTLGKLYSEFYNPSVVDKKKGSHEDRSVLLTPTSG